MHFHVVTLFPEMIEQAMSIGIVGQALRDGRVHLTTQNPREFTADVHHTVDDRPFGGGDGMIMLPQTLSASIDAVRERHSASDAMVVHLSPRGRPLDDSLVREIARDLTAEGARHGGHLILLASRYGGVDQRVLNEMVDMEISIGDYILTGGELPALVLMDALARHSQGVVGNANSVQSESFAEGLLEHPQFTRPREWAETSVPEILLSGNHDKISRWKAELSLLVTLDRRSDLLEGDRVHRVRVLGETLTKAFVEKAGKTWMEMTEHEREVCGISSGEKLTFALNELLHRLPESPKRKKRES